MTAKTNKQTASKLLLILLVIFFTGIYSCNNAADEKKAEGAAVDTMKTMTDTTHAMMGTDTTKSTIDTSRETKVPH